MQNFYVGTQSVGFYNVRNSGTFLCKLYRQTDPVLNYNPQIYKRFGSKYPEFPDLFWNIQNSYQKVQFSSPFFFADCLVFPLRKDIRLRGIFVTRTIPCCLKIGGKQVSVNFYEYLYQYCDIFLILYFYYKNIAYCNVLQISIQEV